MENNPSGTGPLLAVRHLNFTYPERALPALRDVSLTVAPGEFVVVCGSSGCGKTTLLRHLKPGLAPYGQLEGELLFEQKPLSDMDRRNATARIGFVLQNPDNQIVTDKVWHELAFGLESLGFDAPAIRLRVAEMASFFGIHNWFYQDVTELSGGQKQILALAAIMALHPSLLLLDEPTSQLDPIAASDFLVTIGKINRELGTTVILTEHRLEEALPMADRVVVMDRGSVLCEGSLTEASRILRRAGHGMLYAMPVPVRVWARVENSLPCPVTVREGRQWLSRMTLKNSLPKQPALSSQKNTAIELEEVWFRYDRDMPDVLKGLSFKARPGELSAILGGNGTGKTTALALMAGLNIPWRGTVRIEGKRLADIKPNRLLGHLLGVLPQSPQSLFVAKTVREDLLEILSDTKLTRQEKTARLNAMAALCRLRDVLDVHPYDLSGGEQQRAALAKVLLLKPRILLLDEPTKGLDAEFKRVFAHILRTLTSAGVAVVMVSHDIEFCAEYADRCALFFDGAIIAENPPQAFFSGNSFYTSAANRMARQVLPQAVTADDVIVALGGQPPPPFELPDAWEPPDGLELPDESELPNAWELLAKSKLPDAWEPPDVPRETTGYFPEAGEPIKARSQKDDPVKAESVDPGARGPQTGEPIETGPQTGASVRTRPRSGIKGISPPRIAVVCCAAVAFVLTSAFALAHWQEFTNLLSGGNEAIRVARDSHAVWQYGGLMCAFALEVIVAAAALSWRRDKPAWTMQIAPLHRRFSKRALAAIVMIVLVIPLTIYGGMFFLEDRRSYLVSLLIMLEAMLPFVLMFESRRPQARELLILAVLCAIAVAGRVAFFMLPQFKPVMAVVIIAGVAFGSEAGFLVGVLTGFVSNMFFGQGPWTPWQMFALGIIGFLAGVLFRKGLLSRSRFALCVFGGLATFLIYGGLLNSSYVLTYQSDPTLPLFLAAFIQGIPFDLIHALATVTFLALIARPLLEKLDRIKVKYGLIECPSHAAPAETAVE
ncbi:MAG: ATP-binding cassette domain-containing protein [Coriobacteriales bacterium]|nr:ATP-binding cassette domain-containing protein [Coriobacteriales bacterium]